MSQPLPKIERPGSLLDFVRMFPPDEFCVGYLFSVRYPKGAEETENKLINLV